MTFLNTLRDLASSMKTLVVGGYALGREKAMSEYLREQLKTKEIIRTSQEAIDASVRTTELLRKECMLRNAEREETKAKNEETHRKAMKAFEDEKAASDAKHAFVVSCLDYISNNPDSKAEMIEKIRNYKA